MVAECLDGALFYAFWPPTSFLLYPYLHVVLSGSWSIVTVVVACRKKLNALRFNGDPRLQPKLQQNTAVGMWTCPQSNRKESHWITLFFKDGTRMGRRQMQRDSCLSQQDNASCHKAKRVQKWFEDTVTSLRCQLGLQIPQISIKYSIYGMCWMVMLCTES